MVLGLDLVPTKHISVNTVGINSGTNRLDDIFGFEVEQYADDFGIAVFVLLVVPVQPIQNPSRDFGLKICMLFTNEAEGLIPRLLC
ncbi:hypothetical protein SH501x_004742 [Pirellulaceae bacterium SH501]